MASLLHRNLFLSGPAGRLESLLWDVPNGDDGRPVFAAVVCHPHPLFGGTMHNKVVYQAAKTLHRFGFPVLRFNFRGVGASEGQHDKGRGEAGDVNAALDFLATEYAGVPLLLAGFSFGSWVGLRMGCIDPRVSEMIGLGLPVGQVETRNVTYLNSCRKPKLLVTGAQDEFAPSEKMEEFIAQLPPEVREQTATVSIPAADHFFTGHLPKVDQTISTWLISRHPELQQNS